MHRPANALGVAAGLSAILAFGCTAVAPAVPVGSEPPSQRPAGTIAPAAPTASAERVETEFRTEAGGLVLSATLDHPTVGPGGTVVVTATVRNATDQPIGVGGCGKPSAMVRVAVPRVPAGTSWSGIAGRFKQYVLEDGYGPGIVPALDPLQVPMTGGDCGDFVLETPLAPGDTITSVLTWTAEIVDGVDALDAPVPFTVSVGYGLLNAPPSRAPDATGPGISWSPMYHQLSLDGTIQVVGTRQVPIGPGEAIDALLADPTFAHWLAERPAKTWSNANLFLTSQPKAVGILPAGPSWDIELFREVGVPRNWAIAFVDPFDASVRSVSYCNVPCER